MTSRLFLQKIYFLFVAFTFAAYFGVMLASPVRADAGVTRYVASTGSDSGDCSSSTSPCRTIQYAVNQSYSGDKILVAQGTYTYNPASDLCTYLQTRAVICFVDKSLTIFGGYSVTNWLTANPSVNLTVIDGENAYRGVAVTGYNTTTTHLDMEGFTIQNGRAQGPTYLSPFDPSAIGGGMWVQNAAVTLKDLAFKNNQTVGANTSSGAGGAADGSGLRIESSPAGTSSLLQRVVFDNNQSHGGTGPERGGLVFGALYVYGSTVTVEDATFTNNLAQAGSSSGNGTTSDGRRADALGGAIGLMQSSASLKQITATNNQVIGGNAATNAGGGFGGAIYSEEAVSPFVMTDSFVYGNTAQAGNAVNGGAGVGGGILIYNSRVSITFNRVQVILNTVAGGSSTNGGGFAGTAMGGGLSLWVDRTGIAPEAFVTNIIVADNLATAGTSGNPAHGGGGGGIQVQGLQANITHATIARNRLGPTLVAGQGLLVLSAPGVAPSTANVNYSIIADHTVGKSGASAILVQQDNTLNLTRGLLAGNTKDTNADNLPMDVGTINGLPTMLSASSAGFVSPGSPIFNYHITSASPAINQAVNSTTPVDMDGQPRPYGPVSDIGADEYVSPVLVAMPDSISAMTDNNNQIIRSSLITTPGPTTSWTAQTNAVWLYLGPSGTSNQSSGQTGDDLIIRFAPGNVGLGSYDSTINISSPSATSVAITVHLLKVDELHSIYLPFVVR